MTPDDAVAAAGGVSLSPPREPGDADDADRLDQLQDVAVDPDEEYAPDPP
ncbi:hypothetical protein [Fodinibacter luteus]